MDQWLWSEMIKFFELKAIKENCSDVLKPSVSISKFIKPFHSWLDYSNTLL